MPIDPTLTNLSDKNMSNRDLRGVSFARMRCMRANFAGSDLRGCDFREADCTEADFSGAQLEGADFTGAILDRARLPFGADGVAIIPETKPAIEAAPLVRVKMLEEDNKRLEDDNAHLRRLLYQEQEERANAQDVAIRQKEENALLRQQLDDALAEIRRLQQPTITFDGSSAVVSGPTPPAVIDMVKEAEQERPTRRRRSNKSNG